jgi:excisionase family DNA binding protein
MRPEDGEEVFGKKGAAQFLRVKERTIYEWMKKGLIPYSKLPSGAVRFRRQSLLKWMDKYKVDADEPPASDL